LGIKEQLRGGNENYIKLGEGSEVLRLNSEANFTALNVIKGAHNIYIILIRFSCQK